MIRSWGELVEPFERLNPIGFARASETTETVGTAGTIGTGFSGIDRRQC